MTTLPSGSEAPSRGTRVGAIVLVLLAAACWLMILLVFGLIVPRFLHIFGKFKIESPLPVVTQVVGEAGLAVRQFWYLFGPAWLVLTVSLMLWMAKTHWKGALTFAGVLAGASAACTPVVITTVTLSLFFPLKELIRQVGQQ